METSHRSRLTLFVEHYSRKIDNRYTLVTNISAALLICRYNRPMTARQTPIAANNPFTHISYELYRLILRFVALYIILVSSVVKSEVHCLPPY